MSVEDKQEQIIINDDNNEIKIDIIDDQIKDNNNVADKDNKINFKNSVMSNEDKRRIIGDFVASLVCCIIALFIIGGSIYLFLKLVKI